ncbi:MAG: hypothetical protein M3N47_13170 [Chloroflexota bacterium]|nr:hypothetical protein [Chloroflexota bacterium]
MSRFIPSQHPAVVLRSQYVQLRALLAIAMIAVVALSVAVAVLAATDGGGGAKTGPAQPLSAPAQVLPGQRYDGGPDEGTRGPLAVPRAPSTRYDGGPEEGTRGAPR